MKIWCCLCFTEDDESGNFDDIMKEGFPVNESDPEENIGNTDDDDMELGFPLELFSGRDAADEGLHVFKSYEEMIGVRDSLLGPGSGGEAAPPIRRMEKWWQRLRGSRRFEGESSSGGACSGGLGFATDDLQYKRARVLTSP